MFVSSQRTLMSPPPTPPQPCHQWVSSCYNPDRCSGHVSWIIMFTWVVITRGSSLVRTEIFICPPIAWLTGGAQWFRTEGKDTWVDTDLQVLHQCVWYKQWAPFHFLVLSNFKKQFSVHGLYAKLCLLTTASQECCSLIELGNLHICIYLHEGHVVRPCP